MTCPVLERRACETVDLELEIGIAEYRAVEGERVG
jgi:hypothetical protein